MIQTKRIFFVSPYKAEHKDNPQLKKACRSLQNPKKASARRGKQLTQILNQCAVTLIASEVS